jgi:hypothetical protein
MSEAEALEKFADQIGVIQSVATFFLRGNGYHEVIKKTSMYLKNAEDVKGREEACQFDADALLSLVQTTASMLRDRNT